MKAILDWLPLVWTVRIGLLIVLAGGVYLYVLLVAPFLRWRNIRNMVLADLPRVASVGGEFAGARAEVKLAPSAGERQIAMMQERLEGFRKELDQLIATSKQDPGEEGWKA